MFFKWEWMNKLWHTHTMEYYSVINRNKLINGTKRVNLKLCMLSGRSLAQKATGCIIPLTGHSGESKAVETGNTSVAAIGKQFLGGSQMNSSLPWTICGLLHCQGSHPSLSSQLPLPPDPCPELHLVAAAGHWTVC